jgi:hypothetical protein
MGEFSGASWDAFRPVYGKNRGKPGKGSALAEIPRLFPNPELAIFNYILTFCSYFKRETDARE